VISADLELIANVCQSGDGATTGLCRRIEPDDDSPCPAIDLRDVSHLIRSFKRVLLIDTDGVDPQSARLLFVSQMLQGDGEVTSHADCPFEGVYLVIVS